MRRLYVLPKSLFTGQIKVGTHMEMPATSESAKAPKEAPVMLDVIRLFHPMIGAHYVDLPNGMILMCTSFDHSELAEDSFHAHPEVAILPHPAMMGKVALKDHTANHAYKFQAHHLDALKAHPAMGVEDTDTVIDLARKAALIHPEVRFRNVL